MSHMARTTDDDLALYGAELVGHAVPTYGSPAPDFDAEMDGSRELIALGVRLSAMPDGDARRVVGERLYRVMLAQEIASHSTVQAVTDWLDAHGWPKDDEEYDDDDWSDWR